MKTIQRQHFYCCTESTFLYREFCQYMPKYSDFSSSQYAKAGIGIKTEKSFKFFGLKDSILLEKGSLTVVLGSNIKI